jgi:hypothetical protein
VFSFVIAILTIRKVRIYPWLVIFEGGVLSIWLTVQIIFVKMFYPPLHIPYYLTGIFLILTGRLLVKRKS